MAARYCNLQLEGARLAIQGFGSVGKHAARFLAREGAILVAASDSKGTVRNSKGINVAELIELKAAGKSVIDYPDATKLASDAVIDVECDIWIPAARLDVIRDDNVRRLNTRLVLQGANIPFTPGAEKTLHEMGVIVIPDFIANAGGVICAAMEYRGATQAAAFVAIAESVRANTEAVLAQVKARRALPREAALEMATQRVNGAMQVRRFSIM